MKGFAVLFLVAYLAIVSAQKIPLPVDGCVPSETETCQTAEQIPQYILTTQIFPANSSCAPEFDAQSRRSTTTFINHKCSPDLFAFLPYEIPATPPIPVPPATESPADAEAKLLAQIKIARPALANLDMVLVGYPADTGCFGLVTYTFPTFTNDTCVTVPSLGNVQVKMVWSVQGVASSVCIHKDSKLHYKGKAHSFEELEKHQDCHVPHTVLAQGVSIVTSCGGDPLRVTGDHLVYSNKGLVAAQSLRQGDSLYADLAHTKACKITKIFKEDTVQTYKGLNCKESVVLASGIKTSTFGRFHTIPSLWMKHASKVLGVERASRWGDHVVNALVKVRLY